jgi:DNA-binding response OmpR family regulator
MVDNILLVEPDFVWQDMLGRHLREWGLVTRAYPTGRQALEAAPELSLALAVVELDLPDMDGLALVRGLRGKLSMTDLPIIILTRRRERNFVESALENAVNEYLVKSEHVPVQIARRIAFFAGVK